MKLVRVSDCWGVRLCSIVELFDYRTFDCFRLAKFFLWVRLSSITEPNRAIGFDWVRLPNVRLTTSGLIKTASYVHLRNFEQQVSLKKEEEREKLVFGWKIEDVANIDIGITGREIFLSKKPVSRNENAASICKFESKTLILNRVVPQVLLHNLLEYLFIFN